jgi:hypothetical protein
MGTRLSHASRAYGVRKPIPEQKPPKNKISDKIKSAPRNNISSKITIYLERKVIHSMVNENRENNK